MEMIIGGKNYKVEFTFKAALDTKCVDNVFNIQGGLFMMPKDDKSSEYDNIKNMISHMSDLPMKTVENLYAGLLAHHGTGRNADGSVTCVEDAMELYEQFCEENPEDTRSDFHGLLASLSEQMEVDGFFKRIGLTQLLGVEETETKETKKPTDRQKKAPTKASLTSVK